MRGSWSYRRDREIPARGIPASAIVHGGRARRVYAREQSQRGRAHRRRNPHRKLERHDVRKRIGEAAPRSRGRHAGCQSAVVGGGTQRGGRGQASRARDGGGRSLARAGAQRQGPSLHRPARRAAVGGKHRRVACEGGQSGSVRVLVNVAARYAPQGILSAAEVTAQRASIARLQKRVVDATTPKGAKIHYTYEANVPTVAMLATPAALDALRTNPAVARVEEDDARTSVPWSRAPRRSERPMLTTADSAARVGPSRCSTPAPTRTTSS